jgi:hypothetical protein
MGSKSVNWNGFNADQMFMKAIEFLTSNEDVLKLKPDTYIYGEYLQKPKHNTLAYESTPRNHIVIFDVVQDGRYLERNEIEAIAEQIQVDVIPELYRGTEMTIDMVKEFVTEISYLGKEVMEGVVIKNYDQTVLLGGKVFPLFTKYVREDFKERNNKEWSQGSNKSQLQVLVESYRTEARWEKAFQHLRDKGEIENQPRDIGKLMPEVKRDILEEEKENIKEELWKIYGDDVVRRSTAGLPEWYKNKLLESVNENSNTD